VLIDSSHPDQSLRFKAALPPESPGEWWELPGLRNGPSPSFSSEGLDFAASYAQVRAASSLGEIPLIVLTRDPNWPGGRRTHGGNQLSVGEQQMLSMRRLSPSIR
jgi:hypothetical protein